MPPRPLEIRALQARIAATFGARDRARGVEGTFRRLVEELGEVAKALRHGDRSHLALEVSDLVAWTVSVAVLCGIDLEDALSRYRDGCPRCGASPCACPPDRPAAPAG
jgi:NTP pyrophosphatase (non-canonical NTP hydrolase)